MPSPRHVIAAWSRHKPTSNAKPFNIPRLIKRCGVRKVNTTRNTAHEYRIQHTDKLEAITALAIEFILPTPFRTCSTPPYTSFRRMQAQGSVDFAERRERRRPGGLVSMSSGALCATTRRRELTQSPSALGIRRVPRSKGCESGLPALKSKTARSITL